MKQLSEIPQMQVLQQQLKTRKPTITRFRLPYPTDVVYQMLLTSCITEVEYRYRRFEHRPEYLAHIREAAEWFTSKSTKFGMFLCGTKGNGKTTLMNAIVGLIEYCKTDEDCKGQYSMCATITAKELVLLSKAYNNPNKDNYKSVYAYEKLCKMPILAIDDLGTEPSSSRNYGDYVTAAIDIIRTRYDKQLLTIATSNLAAGEIKGYYDELIADRFREMMKIINFDHEPSFRTDEEINN